MKENPFAILQLDPVTCTAAEIKKRYLALVREYPPERDSAMFQRIRSAYDAIQAAGTPLERLSLGLLPLLDRAHDRDYKDRIFEALERHIRTVLIEELPAKDIELELKRLIILWELDNNPFLTTDQR